MKNMLILSSLLFLCGCQRYLDGLYAPIPPYEEPITEFEDVGVGGPVSLGVPVPRVTNSEDSVLLAWSPVQNADYYEVQIDSELWVRVDDTQYTDVEAMGASVLEPTLRVSDLEFREHVRVEVSLKIERGQQRAYRVRAVSTAYTLVGDSSDEVVGYREAGDFLVRLEYQDDPSSDEWFLLNLDSNSMVYNDIEAPPSGEPRTYRCAVTLTGVLGETSCNVEIAGRRVAVEKIYAGGDNTCALFNTGQLKCWGTRGVGGALGTGASENSGDDLADFPLPYLDLKQVTDVWMGPNQSCARSEGEISCWGWNQFGQLATGTTEDQPTPAGWLVEGTPEFLAFQFSHGCAVFSLSVKCWGMNQALLPTNEVYGAQVDDFPLPGLVVLGSGQVVPKEFVTGLFHACALIGRRSALGGDYILCWGAAGLLGAGTKSNAFADTVPVQAEEVILPATPLHLVAGVNHNCAILDDGSIRCWGQNNSGQLGRGDKKNPVGTELLDFPLPSVNVLGVPRAISAGGEHTCVIVNEDVVCWGLNDRAQLGAGDLKSRGDSQEDFPLVPIAMPIAPKQLASGNNHTCALLVDGEVVCWGDNGSGQLGYGDTDMRGDQPEDFPLKRLNLWD